MRCDDPTCHWSHRGTDRLKEAWGIIANASDWDMPGRDEWRQAAERFRDWSYPSCGNTRNRRLQWRWHRSDDEA